jgi:hypothetical protein
VAEELLIIDGRYAMLDMLGAGGMSEVWRARDEILGRVVAVKLLSGRWAADPASRWRIRDEARTAAALTHPNVCHVYDYGESEVNGDCLPYVVMELVAGRTIEQCVQAGPMPARAVVQVCAQVAAALAAAHEQGLVHRDIKPANIMLTGMGAKVVDFGIAAAVGGGAAEPTGEIMGTPAYLAPERIIGDAVEPASDVYALGVMLYRLLAGRLPWQSTEPTGILAEHLYRDPAPLPDLPDLPPTVRDLCAACLRKDPAGRPTAGEVAEALERAAGLRTLRDDLAGLLAGGPAVGQPTTALPAADLPAPLLSASTGRSPNGAQALGARGGQARARGREPVTARPRTRGRRAVVATAGAGAALALVGLVLATVRLAPPPLAAATAPGRSQSPSPTSTTPAPAASGPSAASTTTGPGTTGAAPTWLSSAAGAVAAACTDAGLVRLVSWTAVGAFTIQSVDPGPAASLIAEFRHGQQRIRMTVVCAQGVPSATTSGSGPADNGPAANDVAGSAGKHPPGPGPRNQTKGHT